VSHGALAAALLALGACALATERPPFDPFPEAPTARVELSTRAATRRLVEQLERDSIPLAKVAERDGYVETAWLDAATLRPATRRPLGDSVVRLRAWVDPGPPRESDVTIELAWTAVADPSADLRSLERPLPADHPLSRRVRAALDSLRARYAH